MCFCQIRTRLLCFSAPEEVLADVKIQSSVLFRELCRALKFGDSLRELLVFDEYETFVDEIFKGLFVGYFRPREYSQTQLVAMYILFLFDCVSLAALAPHALESLCFHDPVFSE